MVLQNSGRYKSEKRTDFESSASGGDHPDASGDAKTDVRVRQSRENDAIDKKFGFVRTNSDFGREEVGYLVNMHSTEIIDDDKRLIAAVDYYFVQEDGARYIFLAPGSEPTIVIFGNIFAQKKVEEKMVTLTQMIISKKIQDP
jgi:DNA polymerase epsilon subunit 1